MYVFGNGVCVVCSESKQLFRGSVFRRSVVMYTSKKPNMSNLCRTRHFGSLHIDKSRMPSTYNFRCTFCDYTHPRYMRSFDKSTEKYAVQYEYNTKKDSMTDVHLPACQLRLMNLTGIESEGSIDRPSTDLVKHDGFFQMNLCNDALNALDRCGWKRSYHQRTFKDLNIITNQPPNLKISLPINPHNKKQ